MTECCGPAQPCCGATPPEYDYGPADFVEGSVPVFGDEVPRVSRTLTAADRAGARRVRFGIGRSDFRVKPGLYAVGEPDDLSPVLVTANYKLTFDIVRSSLQDLSAWVLVVDSRGVNVWCAAGKGTFSTAEVARAVRDARLEQVVSHNKLILPQLSATGVTASDIRSATGFSVVWGPVRVSDVPAFVATGMKATEEMRRVHFTTRDRAALVGVELSVLWRGWVFAALLAGVALVGLLAFAVPGLAAPVAAAIVGAVLAVIAGAAVMPVLLPWLPGRTFSSKGAAAGVIVISVGLVVLLAGRPAPLWAWGVLAAGSALASFTAMNFTGSSTYTSPSGVEWEMRRAIPAQAIALLGGVALFIAGIVTGGVL